MKKLSSFLLLFACFATFAFAQNTVIVTGTVTDLSNVPIANKQVDLTYDSTSFVVITSTAFTDANGFYADTVSLPPAVTQGIGIARVYDCNQSPVYASFAFNPGNYNISGVDFQICNSPSSSCTASFSSNNPPNTTTVNFTDLSTGGAVSWAWDFGDGSTSTQQNPTHTYNSTGPFLVCLTINTANSCTSTYCDSVAFGGGSSCSAMLIDTVNGNSVNFFALPNGTGTPVAYSWDFGDGNSQSTTGSSTSHTYTASGSYVACVTVLFSDSCTATSCSNISIGGSQVWCNAGYTANSQPTGVAFSSNSSSSGTILSYVWDFGDGTVVTTTSGSTSHSYAGNGPYAACLTIITSDSCSSTYCDTLAFNNAICQAGFYHFPDTSGQYTIIGVNTSTGQGLSYSWDFGDGNSSTLQFPIHQYAGPGTYVICLTVSNTFCTSTYCDSVTVTQKMLSAFTFAVLNTATSVNPVEEAKISIDLWPNPAKDEVSIRLETLQAGILQVQVLDLQGRVVMETAGQQQAPGERTLRLNVQNLPSGMYLTRVRLGEETIVRKLLIE